MKHWWLVYLWQGSLQFGIRLSLLGGHLHNNIGVIGMKNHRAVNYIHVYSWYTREIPQLVIAI